MGGAAAWALVTDEQDLAAVRRLAPLGPAAVVIIGSRELADLAATMTTEAHWIEAAEGIPPEAYAAQAADIIAAGAPRAVAASTAPASRAALGATAARCGAVLLPGVLSVRPDGSALLVDRLILGGEAVETDVVAGVLCAVVAPDDEPPAAKTAGPVSAVATSSPAPMRVASSTAVASATGLADAQRVVSIGRGVRSRADLRMLEELAAVLDAELACSMPVADDLGWLPKERYVGRTGQHITPRLYLAVGLSGAPQHLEGIRGAKLVVAINTDPTAGIFKVAQYGVVGDLYEIVPALTAALRSAH